MTAMQELLQDIKDGGSAIYMIEKFYIEKEKQQIIDTAVEFGNQCAETMRERGEEYYKQTYKK